MLHSGRGLTEPDAFRWIQNTPWTCATRCARWPRASSSTAPARRTSSRAARFREDSEAVGFWSSGPAWSVALRWPPFRKRGHEVIGASLLSSPAVDATDPRSIRALFDSIGSVDAVVAALGSVSYEPLGDLDHDDFVRGLLAKTLSQVDVVRLGLGAPRRRRLDHPDHGHPRPRADPHGSRGRARRQRRGRVLRDLRRRRASAQAPHQRRQPHRAGRGDRLPRLLPPGFPPVSAAAVGQAFVRSVHGVQTGQVFPLDGR